MKLPTTVFIKHCPDLTPERRTFLEKHLEERVPISDVRWIEEYNHDDLFVWWMNQRLKLPYGLKLTSHIVRTIMSWKTMIDENIESALFLEDDVVFHKDWVSIFESLPDIDPQCFLNLGISPFFEVKPEHGQLYVIGNNAGSEGMVFSLQFAQEIMRNLNIDHGGDIILHGHVYSIGKPLLCSPLCHQTSIMEKKISLDHETRHTDHWVRFVQNYATLPKIHMDELFKEFETFKKRKSALETQFYALYGKKVDIKLYEYIMKEGEYKVDILQFN